MPVVLYFLVHIAFSTVRIRIQHFLKWIVFQFLFYAKSWIITSSFSVYFFEIRINLFLVCIRFINIYFKLVFKRFGKWGQSKTSWKDNIYCHLIVFLCYVYLKAQYGIQIPMKPKFDGWLPNSVWLCLQNIPRWRKSYEHRQVLFISLKLSLAFLLFFIFTQSDPCQRLWLVRNDLIMPS